MSIRDIIGSADNGPWEMCDCGCGQVWGEKDCINEPSRSNGRFVSTFDPEHVALMEDVVEAVGAAEIWGGEPGCDTADVASGVHRLFAAMDTLTAYRNERGYAAKGAPALPQE